jgi:acylphosphatase
VKVCKRLVIKGVVQGVGFRMSTWREAGRIGQLEGWVRNLDDGSVEVVVQGETTAVQSLMLWCRQGPRHARVDDVTESDLPLNDSLQPFLIR